MKTKALFWSILLGVSLSACTKIDNRSESSTHLIAEDEGGQYVERVVPVNRYGMYGEQVTLRYYEAQPNVAYMSASDFHQMMLPEQKMGVAKQGGLYLLTANGVTARVNVDDDTFESSSFEDFTNMMSLWQPGMANVYFDAMGVVRYESIQHTPQTARMKFDFKKYDIDLHGDKDGVYLPFTTLADMYSDLHYNLTGFNGERIVINDTPEKGSMEAVDPTFTNECFLRESIADDLAKYRYNELCFAVDNFYGRIGRAVAEPVIITEGLDAALNAQGADGKLVRQLLQSTKTAEFVLGMNALYYFLYDGGHTVTRIPCPENATATFDPRYQAAVSAYPRAAELYEETLNTHRKSGKIRTDMREQRKKSLGDEHYYKKGNTAFCVFNSFVNFEWDAWHAYYRNGGEKPTLQKYPNDDLLILLDALEKAEADPEVENFVIDITTNGGGSGDAVLLLQSLIAGDCRAWVKNTMTGQTSVVSYEADRNLDRRFDEKDKEVKYHLNFAVLTSSYSFSCANWFPALMKDHGILVIGEKSGGGGCCIQQMVTADGLDYRISSFRMLITDQNFQSIDGGVEPHYALDRENHPEAFYDIEALGQIMDAYYNK